MEITAERPPKLARAATAPILGRPLRAPPTEAHVNSRWRTKRFLGTDLEGMENILSDLRDRWNGPPITTANERDKESLIESGEELISISGDGEESRGT